MSPAGVPDEKSLEKQIEKQMGCMAGFLQLFDRHQILAGKRTYNKRLPAIPAVDSTSSSEISVTSPMFSTEKQQNLIQQQSASSFEFTKSDIESIDREDKRSPLPEIPTPVEIPAILPLPLPIFEFKEGLRSSWKLREAPRLSLDSRATVDGRGSLFPKEIRTNRDSSENDKQRRSPSVVARLMGLEALPDSVREPRVELRRSASESRVSRDLSQYRLIDGNNLQLKQTHQLNSENVVSEERLKPLFTDTVDFFTRKSKYDAPKATHGGLASSSPWNYQQHHRKSFFDSQDFFPEPKRTGSLYGEIEKRLKMRGVDEPAKDLETLKQILEALQLKGLLHSKKPVPESGRRNFVYDSSEAAPIIVMRPTKPPVSINRTERAGKQSPPTPNSRFKVGMSRNHSGEILPPIRPRRDRQEINRNLERSGRNSRTLDLNESNVKSPSSMMRRKTLSIETQKRGKDSGERRSSSPGHSPRISPKVGSDLATSRSPSNRKQTAEISPKERISGQIEEEFSSISESSISTSSQIDIELQRSKMEDYKEGRSLLERCDKLLHSIAEITAISPVSVLDSSFYKEDGSPSPVLNRCIVFKDESIEGENEHWSPAISPVRSKLEDGSDDQDFLYVSEILRSSHHNPRNSDLFALLEKQHFTNSKTNSSSKASRLHRRVVFETVTEIFERKRHVSPWQAFSRSVTFAGDGKQLLCQIWSEVKRIRERDRSEEIGDVICGILVRDMAGDGWGDPTVEISDAVLDIERLIFKDLIAETIRDFSAFAAKFTASLPRRKLVF
ncbi:zinc finger CCCH domain protein [Tasmannia lanceolata]|uniref:zinc finger CCCH domain protein n=1 Tax=Tasmannia lanceolata TaxID=3420 RepID=UPI004062BDDA